jgi:hypothetical protein
MDYLSLRLVSFERVSFINSARSLSVSAISGATRTLDLRAFSSTDYLKQAEYALSTMQQYTRRRLEALFAVAASFRGGAALFQHVTRDLARSLGTLQAL